MTLEWTMRDAARVLRRPTATEDKYSRGVLGVRTGSQRYPGAAVLGVEAAHRTGVGMVRYLGPERPTALVLARRPETVTEDGRVQAWLIGSGMPAMSAQHGGVEAADAGVDADALRAVLGGPVPVVVDAGAIELVVGRHGGAPVVVTPHDREHARLRAAAGLAPADALVGDEARAAAALETAAALGATVLLKGSRTIVATRRGQTLVVASPTTWLATAGTGDVLGGILGALVAAASDPLSGQTGPDAVDALGPLAATAALLHGHAAAAASAARGGGPITALDVADAVASVVGGLLGLDAPSGPAGPGAAG
ncbi:MAG: NAD(P)H-hydrate dehydratase [Microbacterium sp. SCN 70-200]|uniref:ADP-dependent NAD(P)H-hydrate dehydratase n=1 Tax=unclassified Microbacterium TaxID=2609290 RepID=UPI00086EB2DE|nr:MULTISPECIES: ADP/ATP-dependent (S)-NAD(P)H-hydrate dehydratase [unclassified Microbacterium]MBN9213912.1 NAD(P)H-hydrate dehydratase [Microbacterium sp.]ODT42452.1 MAG: NAD(P)H-hydrate dehydratase [Microbacterium sp. SCN 70-200]OJV85419.1 MAG: NAD(P)H-hydrate dehydratase [Microbacterium sp. 70-16]